jgi:hypothetical protein
VNILARFFDERFLTHRQRSTSLAGMISAAVSLLLFEYRFYVNDVFSRDLLAVGVTFVAVKLALMVWYAVKD